MALLFQAFFAFASVDFFINGPAKGHAGIAGVAVSGIALATNKDVGYLVACLLWLFLFLVFVDKKTPADAEAEVETEVKEEEGLRKVPGPVKEMLVKCISDFEKNCMQGSKTCDETEWKVLEEASDLKICRADYPGLSIKRWKVECEIEGDRDEIFEQLFDWNIRLKWDTAIAHGEILEEFEPDGAGDRLIVNKIHTAPAGGGAVSSREMIDAGLLRYTEEGGLYFSGASLGPEFNKHLPFLPKPKSDPVRAVTHTGGGMALLPLEQVENPKRFKYILVTNVDLKGWLMTSVINSATTGALKESTRAMMKQLKTALSN
mmetsp:Transcript_12602/g.14454  ORF Transcript_12602/g.14454 Transcript_12602/m.14454 type:complete len:318 (-) Transcript_12602:161-1114(-)